jgi:hypothetical protein
MCSDDLGQRSVFLLPLTETVELALYSLFKGTRAIVALLFAKRRASGEIARSSVRDRKEGTQCERLGVVVRGLPARAVLGWVWGAT